MYTDRLSTLVDRHLGACAALASLTAVGSVAFAPPAQADIYYVSGPVTIGSAYGFGTSVLFNLDAGGGGLAFYYGGGPAGLAATKGYEFALTISYGFTVFSYFSYDPTEATDVSFTSKLLGSKFGDAFAYNNALGTTFDGSSPWVSEAAYTNRVHSFLLTPPYANDWAPGDSGFVGFKVDKGGLDYYGWLGMTYYGSGKITVHAFAWESTPGTPITAGAVPEPASSSLALVAAGAAGLASWRRRRARIGRGDVDRDA